MALALLGLPSCGPEGQLGGGDTTSIIAQGLSAPPAGMLTVTYYKGKNSANLPVLSIPGAALSHVNYVGATVSSSDTCVFQDPTNDPGKVEDLNTDLKAAFGHLKTSITIQGDSGLTRVAADATKRASFASACVDFMVAHGFDGLDVDWEYPNDSAEGANYTLLMQALRLALNAKSAQTGDSYFLTMAAPVTTWEYNKLQLDQLEDHVDWFNLMTYDFRGPWSKKTGHNSAIYPMSSGTTDLQVCDAGVDAYLARGVPASKLVMGVPFYAYEWFDVYNVPNNNGYQRDSTYVPGPGENYGRSYSFRQLLANGIIALTSTYPAGSVAGTGTGLHSYRWGNSKVPWLFPPNGAELGDFISYDDPQSIAEKGKYIKTPGSGSPLRGGMIWELTQDSTDFKLLDALNWGMAQ